MNSISSTSLLPSGWGVGWGGKFQALNHRFVFLVTSPHPEAIQKPLKSCLFQTEDYHPRDFKGFESSVLETRAKDQILEQEMLLAS